MSRYCPALKRTVVYMECLDCDEKLCRVPSRTQVFEKPEKKDDKEKNAGK